MKPTMIAAAGCAAAAVAMGVAAFASGGDEPRPEPRAGGAKPEGLAVWAQHGCGSCHAFAPAGAEGELGPDLGLFLQGTTPAYIRQSIVDPAATVAPGWDGGAMPKGYARRIGEQDLDALVAFLAESAS